MNVEAIAAQLSDLGAEFIHGGVDAGTNDDANSRVYYKEISRGFRHYGFSC